MSADADGSPYRSPPAQVLVLEGGPSPNVLVVLWAAMAALYALWWAIGWSAGYLPAIFAVVVTAFATVRTARRNRWRFTLERQRLRAERVLPAGATHLGTLEVSQGVRLAVEVPEGGTELAARLTLGASGETVAFYPGSRTRRVHDELVRWLREREVEVDAKELPRLPGERTGFPWG